MKWVMPSETAPQDRVWMAFPRAGVTLGDDSTSAEAAYQTWSNVAHAIVEREPLTMVVDPTEVTRAKKMLSSEIEIIEAPLNDYWMRDIGPTFVVDAYTKQLGAVDWIFNGWGAPEWASWDRDREIGKFVAQKAQAQLISSVLVNEGGGIHVDGEGTVLVTETVQLDPGRNPYADKERIEAELARTIGATKVIWLPRGLTRDYEDFGTRGHVDMVAAIPSPGTLLLHQQTHPEHPDFEVTRALREFLSSTTDAAGRSWNIIDLPAPSTLTDDEGYVDWNYVNHLVINGAVIACAYEDPQADERAKEILSHAYPGREIIGIDAREILARGGGIHCITQQQPSIG